jgi:hypothetical protein
VGVNDRVMDAADGIIFFRFPLLLITELDIAVIVSNIGFLVPLFSSGSISSYGFCTEDVGIDWESTGTKNNDISYE